jgi:hypothetical protein
MRSDDFFIRFSAGRYHARHDELKDALVDFIAANRIRPDNFPAQIWLANLHAALNDSEAHEAICRELLERYRDGPPIAKGFVALTCLISPRHGGVDLAALSALADPALAPAENNDAVKMLARTVKLAAEYRAGHFQAALEWQIDPLEQGSPNLRAQAELFAAMAYHHLGKLDAAKECMSRSQQFLAAALAPMPPTKPAADDELSALSCKMLRREVTKTTGQ